MKDDKKLPSPQPATPDLDPNSQLPPDADVEERFNDFWKRNGPSIFAVIGLIAVIVVGYEVYRYMQVRQAENLAAEYGALETSEQRLEFAEAHPDTQLGGLAYLSLGDEAYAAGNYVDAVARYDAAVEGLAGSPITGRARLGAAMARLRGEQPDGLSRLDQVARDPGLLGPVRGEAAYLLANAHWEAGNIEQVGRALDLLATIDGAAQWQQMGLALEEQIPELDEAASAEQLPTEE